MEEFEHTTGKVFESLSIWRDKLGSDLNQVPMTEGGSFRLEFLLEQCKDCEQAVYGCLKEACFDLNEGVAWGLYPASHAENQRILLYEQAAVEINNDKQLCLQLAHEHGIQTQFAEQVKKSINKTLADFEHVGELRFALMVWRANLQLDLSLAVDNVETEQILRDAYIAALKVTKRCAQQSMCFWSRTLHSADPKELNVENVYTEAMRIIKASMIQICSHLNDTVFTPEFLETALFNTVATPDDVDLDSDKYEDAQKQEVAAHVPATMASKHRGAKTKE